LQYISTVKPVYNGQPWGITKVAFVDRWPLFGNIYTQLMLLYMLQSLHNRQT